MPLQEEPGMQIRTDINTAERADSLAGFAAINAGAVRDH